MITLTRKQAKRFILLHQGLLPPRHLCGKAGVMGLFDRLGCIQFDPLNIVGANAQLVLQARVSKFHPEVLEELLYTDRVLVDDWDKMMSIYPVTDRPHFYYRQIKDISPWRMRSSDRIEPIKPAILREIETRGPLSSLDLDHDTKVDWAWGPMRLAKAALDDMYYRGQLVIHHKLNTRKFYDLAERHIPPEIFNAPDPHATHEEYLDWHIHRRLRSLGLGWDKANAWSGIHGCGTKERNAAVRRLIDQGKILEVQIEDNANRFLVSVLDFPEIEAVQTLREIPKQAAIIAPLDNLLWDRDMLKELFDFSYRWEVYKPVKEREYGYYVLPVLYGDRFVARFEPGRDRKTSAMMIKNWWWEPDIEPDDRLDDALSECFTEFREFLGGMKLKINRNLIKREKLEALKR